MKRAWILLAAALLCAAAKAQYWRALGRGTVGPTSVQTLYGDSVSDRLLAGGTFLHIINEEDTVLGYGQAAWNGMRWDSLATRIQPYGGGEGANQTYWYLRFQGQLYACGNFSLFRPNNTEWTRNLARLNEDTQFWEALECPLPDILNGIQTLVPKAPDSTLYATGYTGTVCGYPESCVFRYDGSAFHIWEPFNAITPSDDNYVGYIFNYKGKTYLTGSVRDPVGPDPIATFLRWNGTAWEHVPGWNTQSPIKEILIHDDTLYVAGTFRYATGGPGNLIARFDGEQWDDMGGGLAYPPVPMSGAALDLEWWHGELLVCGRFTKAGGADCTGIAKWNGQQWCTYPGEFLHPLGTATARLSDMAIWRDSLYVCGGFGTIDGDTIKQVAQWIGGDAVADCSAPSGIHEVGDTAGNQLVVGSLGQGRWMVQLPHATHWTLSVHDGLGHEVRVEHPGSSSFTLDLHGSAPGIYLLRAIGPNGAVRVAKVFNNK